MNRIRCVYPFYYYNRVFKSTDRHKDERTGRSFIRIMALQSFACGSAKNEECRLYYYANY